MKRTAKKLISIFLAAVLMTSLFATTTFAKYKEEVVQSEKQSLNVVIVYEDDTFEVLKDKYYYICANGEDHPSTSNGNDKHLIVKKDIYQLAQDVLVELEDGYTIQTYRIANKKLNKNEKSYDYPNDSLPNSDDEGTAETRGKDYIIFGAKANEEPQEQTHTLVYDTQGGSEIESDTKVTTTSYTYISVTTKKPTRDGYKFINWNRNPDGTGTNFDATNLVLVEGTTTLYAQWEKKETFYDYELVYDDNVADEEITMPASQQASSTGNSVMLMVKSTIPTRIGFNFTGWDTEPDGDGTSYRAGEFIEVTGTTTLYAQWEEAEPPETKNITLTYDANGGIGAPDPQTIEVLIGGGGSFTVSSTEPTKENSVFDNWSFDKDAATGDIKAGFVFLGVDEDITIYAVWKEIIPEVTGSPEPEKEPITITYVANGGKFTSDNDTTENVTRTANEDGKVENFPTVEKEGYAFVKWENITINIEGPGQPGDGGTVELVNTISSVDDKFNENTVFDEDTTLRAVWEKVAPETQDITLTYNANGGTNVPASDTKEVEVGQNAEFTITSDEPTKTGYQFMGWEDIEENTYEAEEKLESSESIILYAVWKANTYTVKFHISSDVDEESYEQEGFIYDEEKELMANKFVKEGYNFLGWAVKSDGEKVYDDQATVKNLTSADGRLARLFAVWEPSADTEYKVIHKQQNINDDGYTNADSQTLTGTTGESVTPSVETYIGFISPDTQTGTILADGTLKIIYKYNRTLHNVEFVIDSEKGTSEDTVMFEGIKYGSSITEPTVTAKEGYVFNGWDSEVAETVTEDAKYTAQWGEDKNDNDIDDAKEDKFTVTYTDGVKNKVIFDDQKFTVLTGLETPVIEEPSRKGYKFKGWTPEVADIVTGDVTYTATWKEITVAVPDEDYSHYVNVVNGYGDGWYKEGKTVSIKAYNEKAGTKFVKWVVVEGDVEIKDINDPTTTFEMVDEYVKVKALFEVVDDTLITPTEKPTTGESGTPQTGDNIATMFALMAMSAVCIFVLRLRKAK